MMVVLSNTRLNVEQYRFGKRMVLKCTSAGKHQVKHCIDVITQSMSVMQTLRILVMNNPKHVTNIDVCNILGWSTDLDIPKNYEPLSHATVPCSSPSHLWWPLVHKEHWSPPLLFHCTPQLSKPLGMVCICQCHDVLLSVDDWILLLISTLV